MKNTALLAVLGIIIPIIAHAETGLFSVIPSGDPKSVWVIDTKTGVLARCDWTSQKEAPTCTPWTSGWQAGPEYRYDPETKKLIPMNDAAREQDKAKAVPKN